MTGPEPPGQVLRAMIAEQGWAEGEFARLIGRNFQFISAVINGKKGITRESACQFGAALGTPPEFWLRLQERYELHLLSRNAEHMNNLRGIRERVRKKSRRAA